jgi:hypothetical protein
VAGAAEVEGLAGGAEHDAGDRAVAGDQPGAGGGDGRAQPGADLAGAGTGVDQVLDAHGDDHVRLDGAQHRQPARGEGVVGELDQGVGVLLRPAALVVGAPAGLHDRLDRGDQLLPADGVELEAAADRAVGVPRPRQGPALGGVGFGTVGVQAGQVVADHLPQLGVGAGRGHLRQGRVHPDDVDALRLGRGHVLRPGHRADRGDLLRGDRPGRGRRGHRR